jgi:hypothetical protein
MGLKEYILEKEGFDKSVEIAKKENHKQYKWEVMVQSNPKIKTEFEKELSKLFDKYSEKTTDGYIKNL